MDWEVLRGVGTLLVWGGFFYLMMRYGCGAHMMGGHGKRDAGDPIKDPVCGMNVETKKATAATVYQGNTYYFCSTTCRDKFEQAPEKFASRAVQGQTRSHGACHG